MACRAPPATKVGWTGAVRLAAGGAAYCGLHKQRDRPQGREGSATIKDEVGMRQSEVGERQM